MAATDDLQTAQTSQVLTLNGGAAQAVTAVDFRSSAIGTLQQYDRSLVPGLQAALANATTARAMSYEWRPNSRYLLGETIRIGYHVYRCTKSSNSQLSGECRPWFGPYPGEVFADGDLQWQTWQLHLPSLDFSTGRYTSHVHSLDQATMVLADYGTAIQAVYAQLDSLIAQVYQAQTVADVQAIVWYFPP